MAGTTSLTDSLPRLILMMRLETETRCDSFGTPGFCSRRFFVRGKVLDLALPFLTVASGGVDAFKVDFGPLRRELEGD